MSLDELNLPKNNLFKITCRDRHDSPNYTFTWELTPYGAAILQEEKVRFPFMYVFAVEEIPPNKVESHAEGCGCNSCAGYYNLVEDKLFCLHEGAGQIQFHRQGTFRIYATVIWYDSPLSVHTWGAHRVRTLSNINMYRSRILDGAGTLHGWSLNHVEEDAVHITGRFFAQKPNPTLWWWANLWWENKPRNSCDYKKRLLFVLWLQLITVSIYVLIRGLVMGLSYPVLLLVGFRPSSLSFRPMFHAFSSQFGQLCDFESNPNYAFKDKSGKFRTLRGTLVRLPIVWVAASVILPYLGWGIYHHPKAYLTALAIVVGFVALLLGLIFLSGKIQSRRKSVELYYEQVPIEKPKKPRVPVRVRWLDATGKLCLPFPE